MTFGEKLQKLRKEKGWTQEQLASQISISRQALSKWELGTAIPDTENVVQISKLFSVSTDYLLYDEYESDDDVWATHASAQKVGSSDNNKTRVIVGVCMAGVSLLAILIIGILSSVFPATYQISPASAVFPESYPQSPASVDSTRVYDGLLGYLKVNNLEWFFILLIILTVCGIATVFYPKIQQVFKKFLKKGGKS